MISIDRLGRNQAAIPFNWECKACEPGGRVSLYLNVKKPLVLTEGRCEGTKRGSHDAHTKKVQAERIQRKCPKRWKHNERMLNDAKPSQKRKNVIVD